MKEIKTSIAAEILVGIVLLLTAITPAIDMVYGEYLRMLHPAVVTVDNQPPELYLIWYVPLHPTRGAYMNAYVLSKDSNRPTLLPASTRGDLGLDVWDKLESSGIKEVTLKVDSTSLTLGHIGYEFTETYRIEYYRHNAWTTPSSGTIVFTAYAKDYAGNTVTTKFYAVVGVPDGQFYINDQPASTDTHIYLNTLDLNFKFKATKVGSAIGSVLVEIYYPYPHGEQIARIWLNETVTDEEWTGSYTLPETGTYEIRGYFYVEGHPYQRMCVVVGYQPFLNAVTALKITFAVMGLSLIGHGAYRYKGAV